MNPQIPLGLGLRTGATFDNYCAGPNSEVVRGLQACAVGRGDSPVYMWGNRGLGKTHLLQAACAHTGNLQQPSAYLPLCEAPKLPVAILEGLESMALVCIDDIHAIAGQSHWEVALFNLFNRIREQGARLLMASCLAPDKMQLVLPDLRSRLTWGPVYRLRELDDEQKMLALQHRAQIRGLELPADAGRYLLRHARRDLYSLFDLLEHLDRASLAAQRKLTIPFIKQVLSAQQYLVHD